MKEEIIMSKSSIEQAKTEVYRVLVSKECEEVHYTTDDLGYEDEYYGDRYEVSVVHDYEYFVEASSKLAAAIKSVKQCIKEHHIPDKRYPIRRMMTEPVKGIRIYTILLSEYLNKVVIR
jgi:hypothetical protein